MPKVELDNVRLVLTGIMKRVVVGTVSKNGEHLLKSKDVSEDFKRVAAQLGYVKD